MRQIPRVVLITTLIVIVDFVLFLVPDSLSRFAFSGQAFFSGEVVRLVVFPFTHVNNWHLLENIVALVIVGFLAYEFELKATDFVYCFIASGIIIALTEGIVFPAIVIAGSSLGIYAVLGALSIKGSNYIPKHFLIPLLGFSAVLKYVVDCITCYQCITPQDFNQAAFHLAGFLMGILVFYVIVKARKVKRKRVFTEVS